MKKFLLLALAAVLLPLAIQANTFEAQKLQGVVNASLQTTLKSHRQMAPARMDLAANQRIMGHYDTDDVNADGGLGLTSFVDTIPIGTILEPSELSPFMDGKIVAFRVGLAQATTIAHVFVIPVGSDGSLGTATEWACGVGDAGWNVITLDTPYEINLEDDQSLMIGFEYVQTSSNYPISAVEVGTIYESYCYLTYQGNTGWYNVGLSSYGNLSVQCIVESDNFADYQIIMGQGSLSVDPFVKAGESAQFTFDAKNFGTEELAAGDYTFDYAIDGKKLGTIAGDTALVNAFHAFGGVLSTEGLATGKHELSVWPATMNGETITDADTLYAPVTVYSNSMSRQKHLVEQLTSSSCTYCPLGTGLLETLDELRDDLAWVTIHGTLYSQYPDPYDFEQCDTINALLGLSGWPSAALDRMNAWDGEDGVLGSLGYYEQYHSQVAEYLSEYLDAVAENMPTFGSIDIVTKFDEETRVADITVEGDLTEDFTDLLGDDATLTVYLIEDSLVSKQLNQGSWVAKYIHNNVMRQALPGTTGTALKIDATENTYKNQFQYTIPADWNADKMSVVAFISRPVLYAYANSLNDDMYVNNAEVVRLGESTLAGIEEILSNDNSDVVPVAYYDIMGREHNGLQRGINIVKMSNGTAHKILVK